MLMSCASQRASSKYDIIVTADFIDERQAEQHCDDNHVNVQ